MVWLSCAAPPWGAVAVGGTVRVKSGGGDRPRKSIIGGLNLLGLLFPYAYTVIYKPKGIFGCQADLFGKFSIVWSRLQCSVAVKTRGGQLKFPCTKGGHFHLRGEKRGGRAAHVSYL